MKYNVFWTKTYYASGNVDIEADSQYEAECIASDSIGDYTGTMQYDLEDDYIEVMQK